MTQLFHVADRKTDVPSTNRRRSLGLFAIAAAALMAGCAATSGFTPAATDARRYHPEIDLGGRLTVRYEREGPQLLNGGFSWKQRVETLEVDLLSPFGQTLARISSRPGEAHFLQSGHPPRTAADVDALAAQTLGWPLPLSGLRAWLQGFPAPHAAPSAAAVVASEGPTALTAVDGWRITFEEWAPDAQQRPRPRRLELARSTQEAGEVRIRIVIDQWQPLPIQTPAQ